MKLNHESCLLSDLQFSCQLSQLCMNDCQQGGRTHTCNPSTRKQREKNHRVNANLGFIESSRLLTEGPFHLSVVLHLLDKNFII